MKFSRRTLRTRVTLTASVATAVAITGGIALLYLQQIHTVRQTMDSQLRTYVTQIALASPTGDWPSSLPDSTVAPSAQAQVIGADGTVLSATRGLTGVPATFALPPGSDTPIRLKGADGVIPDDVQVIGLHETVNGHPVTIIAGVPTGILTNLRAQFTNELLFGFPIVLVIAAAAVWILVGRTLKPVERIRHAVTDITSADLSRRVPEPGTPDEIGHLAETMNRMLDRLEDSARSQRRFVADASHELRSPLAAIRTTLEVALAHSDRAEWPVVAGRAVDQTIRLERLTQDLLLLAKTDAGAMLGRRQVVNAGDLVREVVASTVTGAVTVGLDLAANLRVLGNQADLTRSFRNVLDNAVRYAETTVDVTVESDTEGVRIDVVDDGPGVAAEDRDRVFDRFVRLDASRDRASGNSGLGLAIAREIVSAHHGRIWFADVDADRPGAHLVIRLPRAEAETRVDSEGRP
ncbi:MAG: hypothetical protein JWQ81_7531 [Amycolatopsis sp.]|jgi:signal transduction histidine kinase|uniref:sensor histidine kinase n=1 Tax=Amycolatopsis sp. TaxID=37632 RepID=UPI0026028FDA|nr:ATP-binding protein [Amycolatopsis sp.]MCU1686792.1 hypothetical protein [Amycolatopsis sp.]